MSVVRCNLGYLFTLHILFTFMSHLRLACLLMVFHLWCCIVTTFDWKTPMFRWLWFVLLGTSMFFPNCYTQFQKNKLALICTPYKLFRQEIGCYFEKLNCLWYMSSLDLCDTVEFMSYLCLRVNEN